MIGKGIDDSAEYSGEGDSERHSASPDGTLDAPAINAPEGESNEKSLAAEAQAPPNGGVKAWSQVLGSFFLFFNSWCVPLQILPYPLLLDGESFCDAFLTRSISGAWSMPSESSRRTTKSASSAGNRRPTYHGSVPYRLSF